MILRFLSIVAFGLVFFCTGMVPEAAFAASRQPIVLAPTCPAGSIAAEKDFQEAVDYENARKGVDTDFFRAERLYEKAMTAGSARAALYLGRMYRVSLKDVPGYSPRLQFQAALFERAMTMGCPDAYLFMAEAYQNGWGVKPSMATAWRLVKEGAEKGSMAAMTAWGTNLYFENRYEKAPEAEARRAEAKNWLEKALKQGYGAAGYELAMIYRMYEQDPQGAIRVLREGAALGDANCLYMLAGIYRRGEDGQPKDTAYADVADALRKEIDVKESPRPIGNFSKWLPPREILPYRVNVP